VWEVAVSLLLHALVSFALACFLLAFGIFLFLTVLALLGIIVQILKEILSTWR